MALAIIRKRYIVVNDNNEIFCGLARMYHFKPIDNIGDTAIKTYLSAEKAKSSFLSSWGSSALEGLETGKYRIVEVEESIKEI